MKSTATGTSNTAGEPSTPSVILTELTVPYKGHEYKYSSDKGIVINKGYVRLGLIYPKFSGAV